MHGGGLKEQLIRLLVIKGHDMIDVALNKQANRCLNDSSFTPNLLVNFN